MKKIIFTALALSCIVFNFSAVAQQQEKPEQNERPERPERPEIKEQQEIIIRSKGDTNNVTLKVEIDGNNVLINGKPLVEFKDNSITINKRKIMLDNGDFSKSFNFDGIEGWKELQDQGIDIQNFSRKFQKLNRNFDNAHNEKTQKPFLGVTTEKTTTGAKIVEVVKGSAAEKAGLKNGDIILKIDQQDIIDSKELVKVIATKKPKEAVQIYYSRAGKNNTIKTILGERTESKTINFNFSQPHAMVRGFRMNPDNGNTDEMTFDQNDERNLDPNNPMEDFFPRQKKLGLKIQDTQEGGSVKVIDIEDSSAAQKAGLQKDDLITEINNQKVTNTDEARKQLQDASEKNAYTIKANRNGTIISFEVKFPKKLKTAEL